MGGGRRGEGLDEEIVGLFWVDKEGIRFLVV